ncbi:MAG: SPOR domain-containing protein [Sulfurospirillum sp.]|nr:SPOR domain-containing protein [Sulfurospirillum sp.]
MEDKNELSDIILEKDDNKSMKMKRLLLIAALGIVVFLLVLVVMRVINKPQQNEQVQKIILPPQPTQKTIETAKDEQLFKQVPIIEEEKKKESFEEMVKSLKEKEIAKEETAQVIQQAKEEKQEVKAEVVTKPIIPKVAQKVEIPKQELTKKVEIPADLTAENGYYVQVGATSKASPDKKFLNSLEAQKYQYRLLPINVSGKKVTKILIGPYANSNDAKNALVQIKESINKDAFIFRVK